MKCKTKWEPINRLLGMSVCIATVLSLICLWPTYALSEYKYWFGGTGNWDNPSNWDPIGIPSNSDKYVYVTNDPEGSATVFSSTDNLFGDSEGSLQLYGSGEETMSLIISSGRLETINPFFFDIGKNGVVDQTGGYVYFEGIRVLSEGKYNLAGGIVFPGIGTDLFVYGEFNHTGGQVSGCERLSVQQGGVYNLSGTGEIGFNTGGGGIDVHGGTFNHYAGTIHDTGMPIWIWDGGVFNQYDGNIEPSAWGLEVHSGVFNHFGGAVDLGQEGVERSAYIDIEGTYNLVGGTLTTHDGKFVNDGILNYSGGEFHVAIQSDETLTNNGTVNLSGSGTRTVDGNIVNNGTFKSTHTTAEYTGTFTNNGAYISDPATQYFNDLLVGETGYLVGQYGDRFLVSGDFINYSAMNFDWNTKHSYLGFLEGTDNLHDFYLTGQDYGPTMPGYADNFSWGTLDISDDLLYLYDGNEDFGAALYLREIFGVERSEDLITNLLGFDGLNIYYMPNLPDNEYLEGRTYNLSGGGQLRPSVPEPATMLLLGSGLLGLVGFRRRFRKR